MPTYWFVGYDATERLNTGDFAFRDNSEALAFAASLVTGAYRVEVWRDQCLVGCAFVQELQRRSHDHDPVRVSAVA